MAEIQFFKDVLNTEIKRITNLYEIWELQISLETIPEDVQGIILSVVGQSKLLIHDKLQQFKELINSCNGMQVDRQNSCKITTDDLQGFWDLVYIQIEDINNKFINLDQLKSNKWENQEIQKPKRQNSTGKIRKHKSFDKIHSEAAKSRLAAAKLKLQKKTSEELSNDIFYN